MSGKLSIVAWCLISGSLLITGGCFAKREDSAVSSSSTSRAIPNPYINVMAPLVVGEPGLLNSPASINAWKKFETELSEVKDLGAYAVSTDIWWGIIEPEDNKFYWDYYDRIAETVKKAGLKWVPILSTHQCGGNVGDDCDIPIPDWLWSKYSDEQNPVRNLQYVSEQGNSSREVIAAWATEKVLTDYRELYSEFQNHFAQFKDTIIEINISLGPSGELRYPSYNAHDQGAGYPTRGAFQCFSPTAVQSWKAYVKKNGSKLRASSGGLPPISMQKWIDSDQYKSPRGKLYLEWYQSSLLDHGELLLKTAIEVFGGAESVFRGIDVGAKIPGIHWRIGTMDRAGKILFGDRLAEISSGMINGDTLSWGQGIMGRGYAEIVALFAGLNRIMPKGKVILHFTALEMADGQDRPEVLSMAASLVRWVGAEAKRQQLVIKGENALAGNLSDPAAWKRMASHLKMSDNPDGLYHGLTILRMSDVLATGESKAAFKDLANGKSK